MDEEKIDPYTARKRHEVLARVRTWACRRPVERLAPDLEEIRAAVLELIGAECVLDGARLFQVEGVGLCLLAELRESNAHDEAFCEWLDGAKVGDDFGGFNSLHVERVA